MMDASLTANDVKVEELSGYVDKKNRHGQWQKRFFVLYQSDHTLSYFPDDKKERGGAGAEINMCFVNLIQIDRKVKPALNCFSMPANKNNAEHQKLVSFCCRCPCRCSAPALVGPDTVPARKDQREIPPSLWARVRGEEVEG
mmetsp:Transcript_17352/g.35386  ORF Transcript_17352/g.35386 Transcript_17352/m.35386 type:complete len:142 (+) Transcript_17352:10-435(+)